MSRWMSLGIAAMCVHFGVFYVLIIIREWRARSRRDAGQENP